MVGIDHPYEISLLPPTGATDGDHLLSHDPRGMSVSARRLSPIERRGQGFGCKSEGWGASLGAGRYILGETHRNILARGFATTSDEATQRSGNRITRAAQLSPPTRKMLQPIKKTFYSATRAMSCATTLSVLLGLALAASVGTTSAIAQDSSSTPPDSQSSSQTQKPIAAPGTVALSRATAAALAPYTGPKYDNRWEVYGGLLYMNGQAGQNTPVRYDMGGGEAMGTYWLTKSWAWRRIIALAPERRRSSAGSTTACW